MPRQAKDDPNDHLSALDRSIVGSSKMQIRFEIRDQLDARRVVEILRGFCNRLEHFSDPRAYKEREGLLLMRFERTLVQGRLSSKPKRDL